MKGQWGLVVALTFALIIAVFSVVNVDPVQVNYVFGTSDWPLVLVILGSVLMGAILVLGFGMVKYYRLKRELKALKKENVKLQTTTTEPEVVTPVDTTEASEEKTVSETGK
ncbi:lipopolysaccharide assembly protein LapA domain-containing protein [Pseudalkalibacillus hwajinpoensis]|uniref:LapA family protein n=1 Tax=Guptibacillus hwajinpoensis TaxID=208199 RepID=UPI00325B5459